MCGRFTMRTPAAAVLDHFTAAAAPDLQLTLRYNIAPTQDAPVVRGDAEGSRTLANLKWGLLPFWAEDPRGGAKLINARSETAATKPAFRRAFRQRRCLVPADGYFEWEKVGGKKLPQYIRMKDERLFALAGLWEKWRGSDGTRIDSFTILTTDSNELTRDIHDRMPVILDEDQYSLWLDPEFEEVEPLQAMLRPYSSDEMKMDRVSTRVNNVRHDDPQCLEIQRELF